MNVVWGSRIGVVGAYSIGRHSSNDNDNNDNNNSNYIIVII